MALLIKLLRYFGYFALNPVFLFASLVPKDRSLWLFAAWNGRKYLDNPKYIYRHVLERYPEVRAVWIVRSKTLYSDMRKQSLPVEYAFSMRGILCQLRAAVVVYTHSVIWEYAPFFVGSSTKRVQTWHGMPIKKIGYDDLKAGNTRLRERIVSSFIPYMSERCDLVIASGIEDQEKYRSAFNVKPENVVITGYPRNDELIRSARLAAQEAFRRIIYMPTFRGGVNTEFALLRESGFDFDGVDARLKKMGAELYIKLHPVQFFAALDLEKIKKSENIFALGNEGDIYESIGRYGILITDFSGIYFDYMLTGRPIIMAPFDIENYMKSDRDLYYNYEEICPSSPCMSWDRVLDEIELYVSGREWSRKLYDELRSRFHSNLDDNSSNRTVSAIKGMIH